MLIKSSVVLLGLLVVGFFSILTAPVTAQGGPPVMLHRVCTIAPGQGQEAVGFALEVKNLFDEKWPEQQMFTFRPALQPNNQIHWVTQHENMAAFGAALPVVLQDRSYQTLVQKAEGILVPNSCSDDVSFLLG